MRNTMTRRFLLGSMALLPLRTYAQDLAMEVNGGGGAIWRKKVVRVEVYTDPRWHPFIKTSFSDIKRVSGKRLPRFALRFHPRQDCGELRTGDFPKGTMIWCSRDSIPGAPAMTYPTVKRHGLTRVRIELSDVYVTPFVGDFNQQLVCEELMHGITAVNDNQGSKPDTSCVHGHLLHPGPHDKKLIARMYRKHR